ncbi:mitochondrial inner membrane protein Mitofilin [Rhodocollybia butyracea]|uniref:MICOS complex subunit MIC60 n=1 Tax=Rhodocollybia butyracea TaxID=206335 RepID=A0A9P5PUW6_9AGAR|nr:mitochondrial inner membrane protein Mitofilin [Rhodocollybia butyracea]
MLCASTTRQVASSAGRNVFKVTRRRLATEAPAAPKKPRIVRRIFFATTALTGSFYVGSAFLAFNNPEYYDFFTQNVPLGQTVLEYGEENNWDTVTVHSVIDYTVRTTTSLKDFVMEKVNGAPTAVKEAKEAAEKAAHDAKDVAMKTIESSKERAKDVAAQVKTEVQKEEDKLTGKAAAIAKHQREQLLDGVGDLVRKAEEALASNPVSSPNPPNNPPGVPSEIDASILTPKAETKDVYEAPLPVGFEPPPGFSRPPPAKKETPPPKYAELPLVAPAVSALASSEPVISHLAGTIDNLASFLKTNPEAASRVTDVLDLAKEDLSSLAQRIESVKEEERRGLEQKLDEQTREYTIKLLEIEMESQDRLDNQEEEFRKLFDLRQSQLVQSYRQKLEEELKTQTELINERLKNEVIAQGIELQRRWIREVKMRVEEERGGRLAKIDELSAHLKRIERVALDNSAYLDENIRVHALWSAIRALSSSALSSPVRKPFREELRVARHIAAAREDPVVVTALESLEASEVPDVGVEPFADLASWYTTSVAPKVSNVALVPDRDAGLLSHLASHLLSSFRFKRHGFVEGNDVLSVLSRAEYYLNEKDLDSAARELNQLNGTAKVMLHDWLEAARRRLEVEQALEVVHTQATLASLLVI